MIVREAAAAESPAALAIAAPARKVAVETTRVGSSRKMENAILGINVGSSTSRLLDGAAETGSVTAPGAVAAPVAATGATVPVAREGEEVATGVGPVSADEVTPLIRDADAAGAAAAAVGELPHARGVSHMI